MRRLSTPERVSDLRRWVRLTYSRSVGSPRVTYAFLPKTDSTSALSAPTSIFSRVPGSAARYWARLASGQPSAGLQHEKSGQHSWLEFGQTDSPAAHRASCSAGVGAPGGDQCARHRASRHSRLKVGCLGQPPVTATTARG